MVIGLSMRIRSCLTALAPLAVASAAGCMVEPSRNAGIAPDATSIARGEPAAGGENGATAPSAVDYADLEYDDDSSPAPTHADPLAVTPWNDGDPERPEGFPKTFLHDGRASASTACANTYNLYAAPRSLSPRRARRSGCAADRAGNSAGGGDDSRDAADALVAFLNAKLPGHEFQPMWTPASWNDAEAGGDTDAPA
jgi:hypothetical protein